MADIQMVGWAGLTARFIETEEAILIELDGSIQRGHASDLFDEICRLAARVDLPNRHVVVDLSRATVGENGGAVALACVADGFESAALSVEIIGASNRVRTELEAELELLRRLSRRSPTPVAIPRPA